MALSCSLVVAGLLVFSAGATAQSLQWRSASPLSPPGYDAIVGGPGSDPSPHAPLYVCRARVNGSITPGKWVKGNCNVAFDGREVVNRLYEVAYGNGTAVWRPFRNRNERGLIQTGNEWDGTPLYSCRVRYRDSRGDQGYQPGKIDRSGTCDIAYGGREVPVSSPFEALYVGRGPVGGYTAPLCRITDHGMAAGRLHALRAADGAARAFRRAVDAAITAL